MEKTIVTNGAVSESAQKTTVTKDTVPESVRKEIENETRANLKAEYERQSEELSEMLEEANERKAELEEVVNRSKAQEAELVKLKRGSSQIEEELEVLETDPKYAAYRRAMDRRDAALKAELDELRGSIQKDSFSKNVAEAEQLVAAEAAAASTETVKISAKELKDQLNEILGDLGGLRELAPVDRAKKAIKLWRREKEFKELAEKIKNPENLKDNFLEDGRTVDRRQDTTIPLEKLGRDGNPAEFKKVLAKLGVNY